MRYLIIALVFSLVTSFAFAGNWDRTRRQLRDYGKREFRYPVYRLDSPPVRIYGPSRLLRPGVPFLEEVETPRGKIYLRY